MYGQYEKELKKGESLFEAGQIDEAETVFNSILQNAPDSCETLNNLGVIFNLRGNVQKAEEYFLKAISLKHDYSEALINLAGVYQKAGNWHEAAAQLEIYIETDNQNTDIYNQLGVVYLEMGDVKKAIDVLEKSLGLNPNQKAVKESLNNIKINNTKKDEVGSGIGMTHKPLNILFVQEFPCIRNYKMATALRARGHSVTLAYEKYLLSQVYKGLSDNVYNKCIKLKNYRHLWDISKDYDIIHCHNEPDTLTCAAFAGDSPVIHDTHDLISLRADGDQTLSYFEGLANRGAAGRVYSTPYQMNEAMGLYGTSENSLVFYNYASKSDLPKTFLPKLSEKDGLVHIVYEGGIGGNTHRDFSSLFFGLADKGLHIHIYPAIYNQEIAKDFSSYENIHYNQPLSPKQIMEEMTQYDIGIIPFNLEKGNKRFLDSTIANKLFEYLAAGLPVITSPLQSYIEYFEENPVGQVFHNANDLLSSLPDIIKRTKGIDLRIFAKTYESEINSLEEFYYKLLNDVAKSGPSTVWDKENKSGNIYRSKPMSEIASYINDSCNMSDGQGPVAAQLPTVGEIEKKEQEKYEQIYSVGYDHFQGLKNEIVQFLSRYLNEFQVAIDLGCGTGKYAHYLQEKHKKMVLGIDIVNKIEFPNVRFQKQFAWNLDKRVDFIYAIDLMEHIPMDMVSRSIEAIANNCEIFIADVSTLVDKLGDKIGKRLHVTVKPAFWWIERFAEQFNEVKILKISTDGFFIECRKKLSPVCDRSRMADFRSWTSVLHTASTPYRDIWNQHARSLPWKGKILYVGSNPNCKEYYNKMFFKVDNVVHVDPDSKSNPDVVAFVEDMPMFSDNSVDGVAFFGTPYVVDDPVKMFDEIHRILKPGGIVSGSFNGEKSPWIGKLYTQGSVKGPHECWHFGPKVIRLFEARWDIFYWSSQGDEYYHLSALKS